MSDRLSNHVCILVLHLLRDSKAFVSTLSKLGMNPKRTIILNIPYSTKRETLSSLWAAGFRHLFVSETYPNTPNVIAAVQKAREVSIETGLPILIIEDGGYIGPYIHRDRPDLLDTVAGIVEQTQNGIWEYD